VGDTTGEVAAEELGRVIVTVTGEEVEAEAEAVAEAV
jgi:hypothetical protein